jgi:hypothetical protein
MFFCPAELFQGRGMRISASGIRCVHFKKPERSAEKVERTVPSGLWSWLLTTIAEPGRRYFLSDAFEEKRHQLEAEKYDGADPEEPDEYRAGNVFWVPKEARWSYLQAQAKQRSIGKTIDEAIVPGYQEHFRDQKGNVIGIKKNDPSAL